MTEKYWDNYLKSIGESLETTDKTYSSWSFGNSNEMADRLVNLVIEGKKRGTSSLKCLYDEEEELPKVGEYSIILGSNENPKCIIKNVEVIEVPFNEVTKEMARLEGEGDLSLKYWREAHMNFFGRELKELEKIFSEELIVIYENFELVYKS